MNKKYALELNANAHTCNENSTFPLQVFVSYFVRGSARAKEKRPLRVVGKSIGKKEKGKRKIYIFEDRRVGRLEGM